MNHPDFALMRHYGTASVFFEKAAGGSPFAARVAAAMLAGTMFHGATSEMDRQKMEAHQLNEQFRLAEQRVMGPINQSLQHTRVPMFVQANSDLPVGWDEGMVRLAAIARGAGEDMAKLAIMSPTRLIGRVAPRQAPAVQQSPSVQGTAATPAAAKMEAAAPGALAGAATGPKLPTPPAAAAKGPGMAESLLGKGWKAKAVGYGALAGGSYLGMKALNAGLGWMGRPAPAQQNWGAPGTELPMGVNSYGQPQLGTPLVG